jgi:2-iminobutanoate/2-iminopropanoate deaminase
MRKRTVATGKLPWSLPFISQAVESGKLMFISGLGPQNLVGSPQRQTRETLSSMRLILEEAGATLDDVLKITVYLSDMNNYNAMNDEYRQIFQKDPPARTCVQASSPLASKGQLIEMDAIAAVP